MKTIQTLMKAISAFFLSVLALSAYAAGVPKDDAADVVNKFVDGLVPATMTLGDNTFECHPFRMKKAAEEEHEFTWMEVTTTHGGELKELLGDKLEDLDSLVVNGPINEEDFNTMWKSSLYGYLSVIDLGHATVEDGVVPDYAFYGKEQEVGDKFYYIALRRIILPEGVTRIGNYAFYGALVLEEVNLPSTLHKLGQYAFYANKIKTSPLVIPEGIEEIMDETFCKCYRLGEVVLPSTIKKIGEEAFAYTSLSAINLPEGLESIGWQAFWDTHLKEVTIPNSCLDFGEIGWNFAMNRYLEKIHLPEGMTEIPWGFVCNDTALVEINIPHTVKHIGERALAQCPNLKSLELPLGVQSLGKQALEHLEGLESIVFPASMKTLGAESCGYWENIKEIYCAATEPPVCDPAKAGPFTGYDFPDGLQTPTVYIPMGTMDKYFDSRQNGAGWGGFWNFVEIDPSEFPVTAIGTPAITENRADKADNVIYDLQGRRVENPQKGHIYVSKGKKFVFGR